MGILATRWEAHHQRHRITIARNEVTKGFAIQWDGTEIARRSWSWVGLGELHGTAELDGRPIEVRVSIEWGGLDGKVSLTVDGQRVPIEKVE